jgi:hypothetical protein
MKRFIDYNDKDGSINCIRYIQESDKDFYDTETTSLLEIENDLEIDIRNNKVSGDSFVLLSDIPITYDTLMYNVSSTQYISFSSIPENTFYTIESENIITLQGIVDDSTLELNINTPDIYTITFDNKLYNNLTSTFKLTAL